MNVNLVRYDPDALTLLLTTKGTRLKHDDDPAKWNEAKRKEHLEYMRDTIKSSWEFVDYVFKIEGVTRAFTHQLVRTRTGSYAQEAMRVIDARDHEVVAPDFSPMGKLEAEKMRGVWEQTVLEIRDAYIVMIDHDVPPQDARGILPTNITTSIMCKFNLRTLHDMAKLRMCTRTQGEYQDVFRSMRAKVIAVHPWAEEFLQVHCVSTGTCAFPRYGKKECPVYDPAMDNEAVRRAAHDRFWSVRYEASPRAKDGKAA